MENWPGDILHDKSKRKNAELHQQNNTMKSHQKFKEKENVPPSSKITGTPKGKKSVDFSLHEKAE